MKKSLYFVVLSTLLAVPLVGTASPAFASTGLAAVPSIHHVVSQVRVVQSPVYSRPSAPRRTGENQIFCGTNASGSKVTFKGRNQGNTGNPGDNDGDAQDNSINNGNQVILRRGSGGAYPVNQLFCGSSDNGNDVLFVGENQGNSGNEGYNRGSNQDNSTNNGNQIVN